MRIAGTGSVRLFDRLAVNRPGPTLLCRARASFRRTSIRCRGNRARRFGCCRGAFFFEEACPTLSPALLPVPNTLEALQRLARRVRQQWGRAVVAVTGSTGKSTTKEMIAALLGRRFHVHKSAGNLNNHYGLPLTLLGIDAEDEVAVVELAMSAPGEIARLAVMAEPETGVVTNVAPVHLEFFDSVEAIARAKRELIRNLSSRAGPPTAV